MNTIYPEHANISGNHFKRRLSLVYRFEEDGGLSWLFVFLIVTNCVSMLTHGFTGNPKNDSFVLIFHPFIVTLSQNKQNKRK